MWERIFVILRKEFIQVLREPRMRALLFIPPLLQLIIFGYALSTDIKNVPTAVWDASHTVQSREHVEERAVRIRWQIDALRGELLPSHDLAYEKSQAKNRAGPHPLDRCVDERSAPGGTREGGRACAESDAHPAALELRPGGEALAMIAS